MFGLVADKCPVCGKEFFPKYGWAYRREGTKYCSWKCLRRATKDGKKTEKHEEPKTSNRPKKKIVQLNKNGVALRTFKSAGEVSDNLGYNEEGVRQACRSGKLYKGFYWRYGE